MVTAKRALETLKISLIKYFLISTITLMAGERGDATVDIVVGQRHLIIRDDVNRAVARVAEHPSKLSPADPLEVPKYPGRPGAIPPPTKFGLVNFPESQTIVPLAGKAAR